MRHWRMRAKTAEAKLVRIRVEELAKAMHTAYWGVRKPNYGAEETWPSIPNDSEVKQGYRAAAQAALDHLKKEAPHGTVSRGENEWRLEAEKLEEELAAVRAVLTEEKRKVDALMATGDEMRIELGKLSCFVKGQEYRDVEATMDAWDAAWDAARKGVGDA